jgi:hypothetical protein
MDPEKPPSDWQPILDEVADAVSRAAEAASDPRLGELDRARIAEKMEELAGLIQQMGALVRHNFDPVIAEQIREKKNEIISLIDVIVEKSQAL